MDHVITPDGRQQLFQRDILQDGSVCECVQVVGAPVSVCVSLLFLVDLGSSNKKSTSNDTTDDSIYNSVSMALRRWFLLFLGRVVELLRNDVHFFLENSKC